MMAMLEISFCNALESRSATPHSRMKLPSARLPMSGMASGSTSAHSAATATGNNTRSRRATSRGRVMRTSRSRFVVSSRITGGWTTGTSAM
jgi:hypothetical protein